MFFTWFFYVFGFKLFDKFDNTFLFLYKFVYEFTHGYFMNSFIKRQLIIH